MNGTDSAVAVDSDAAPRLLTIEELASEAMAPLDLVRAIVAAGAVEPVAPDRFDARDTVTISTVRAILDGGVELGDLEWSIRKGLAGFTTVGHYYSMPTPRSSRTYAEFTASLGDAGRHLPAIYTALGLPEPEAHDRLRLSEEEVIGDFVTLWSIVDPSGRAHTRVARVAGEAIRWLVDAHLDVWDATAQPRVDTQGAPTGDGAGRAEDASDPRQNLGVQMADVGRRLVAWLDDRLLEDALTTRIVRAVEVMLARQSRLPERLRRPPAVAFVDLSGFTTFTATAGDEAAVAAAMRLHELATISVRGVGGRVVKLLGDAVLLRFPDAPAALRATLELVAAVADAGLPPAHAGIAAGRIIVRDGDIFGGTVNLAARIGAQAGPGEVLVEEGSIVALPPGIALFEPVGRVAIRGLPVPVALWRAMPPLPF